jgi:hypothetical protein
MGNALWLMWGLPVWFFSTVAHPFSTGPLSLIPFLGVISLVAGVICGVIKRDERLLPFLLSVSLSEVYVAVAGLLRGRVQDFPATVAGYGFIAVQLATVLLIAIRTKNPKVASLLLGIFCFTYALAAAFLAAMSFTNSWL